MSILGTAITAGGSLLGSVASGLFGNHQMAKAEEYNDKIRAEDRQWALEDYERVLRDSSPASQMERLAMAGLNPNLALGGNMSTNVSMPRSVEPVQNPYNRDSPWRSLDALAITDLLSRVELNKSQATKNYADANKLDSETKGQDYENQRLEYQSKYFEDMAAFDWHLKDWSTDIMEHEGKIKQLEYNLRLIRYAAETGKEINIGDFDNFIDAKDTPAYQAFKSDIESKQLTKEETSARIKSLLKGVALTASEIILNAKRGALTDQETERTRLENNLRKNGLNPNDPVWMRIGVQMLAEYLGIDLNDVINKYKNE